MIVFALDPAKLTGFSHSDGTRGVWDLGEPTYRLLRLLDCITDTYKSHPFEILAAENAQQGSHNFTIQGIHAEYRGIIRLCALKIGAEFVLVGPSQLKAWAAGHGRATKATMQKWCEIFYGVRIDDDNECDAFLIMKYVEAGQHLRTLPGKVQRKREKTRRKKEARLF